MWGPSPVRRPATLAVLMMEPPPCVFMTGAACLMPRNTPRRSTPMVASKPSTGTSWIFPPTPPYPALLKMQSSRPKRLPVSSTAACTSGSRLTSAWTYPARDPSSPVRRRPRSSWMSATITDAPSSTKSRTVASPMPLAPPVINATLPLRRVMPPSALHEPHGARHGFEVVRRVSEVEPGREDALVVEVQRMLLAEADGAQELMRAARHALRGPARIGLGHGHVGLVLAPLLHFPGRAIDEVAGRLHIAEEIGAGVLDGLERSERPAELAAASGVVDAELEDPLGAADHLRRAGERARPERRAETFPGVARFAEEIVAPHFHTGEDHLAGTVSRHGRHGEHGQAGLTRVEEEEIRSGGAAGDDEEVVGDMRVVHEELPPVEPALRLAREPERRLVDGRAFLRDGEHADPLSARHGREQALATGRSRRAQEQRGGDHRALHVRAREARAAHLLEEQHDVDHGATAAAVLHGDEETRPAENGDLLPQRSRKAALAGHALRHDVRWTVTLEEIAGGAHEKLLAVG